MKNHALMILLLTTVGCMDASNLQDVADSSTDFDEFGEAGSGGAGDGDGDDEDCDGVVDEGCQ